jgi:hypothetical protein
MRPPGLLVLLPSLSDAPADAGQPAHERSVPSTAVGVDLREINITDAVRAKIGSKHGVTSDQVLAACSNVIRVAWHTDERGRLLYLEGRTEHDQVLFVVLYPTAHPGRWNVATARFLLTGT